MQFIQKLLSRIKRFSHTKVIAIIFIVTIFFIGTATLPSTFVIISQRGEIVSVRDKIDDEYRNMLNFGSRFYLRNKGTYINLNGFLANLMKQRFMNEVIKLDNGYLTDVWDKQDVTLAAVQMTKLFNRQKENGKHFLFVVTPRKVPKYEDILPRGYADFSNQNADELLEILRSHGVPVFDLRDELQKDDISYENTFFVTDHHWKPEAGFWAYTKITDYLVQNEIIEPIDKKYTDITNYNIEIYKDWFLGSLGKRTGIYYVGVDDISIITPNYDTTISLEIPPENISKYGSFYDVAFSHRLDRINYFLDNPYATYGYGDSNGKIYRNANAPSKIKILFIRDSYACVCTTFFTLVATESRELDMRNYGNFGSFQDYYSEYAPDVLIVFVNAGTGIVSMNTVYDFFNDL